MRKMNQNNGSFTAICSKQIGVCEQKIFFSFFSHSVNIYICVFTLEDRQHRYPLPCVEYVHIYFQRPCDIYLWT